MYILFWKLLFYIQHCVNCWIIFNFIRWYDYSIIYLFSFEGHLDFFQLLFFCHSNNTLVLVSLYICPWWVPRNGIAGLRVSTSSAVLHLAIFLCRTTVPIYTPTRSAYFLFPHILNNPDIIKLLSFVNLRSVLCYFLTVIYLFLVVGKCPSFHMSNGYLAFPLCKLPVHIVSPFFYWVVFFLIDLQKFIIYSGY